MPTVGCNCKFCSQVAGLPRQWCEHNSRTDVYCPWQTHGASEMCSFYVKHIEQGEDDDA